MHAGSRYEGTERWETEAHAWSGVDLRHLGRKKLSTIFRLQHGFQWFSIGLQLGNLFG